MTKFTKAEFTAALAELCDCNKTRASAIIDQVFGIIRAETESGKTVNIAGFGRFEIKESAARQGRNPATGEVVEIPAKRRLSFKASKSTT